MRTYPAFIPCPVCHAVAANVTVPLAELLARLDAKPPEIDRFLLRNDQDKPGPSKRLVVCQHCHYPFKVDDSRIIDQPREISTT